MVNEHRIRDRGIPVRSRQRESDDEPDREPKVKSKTIGLISRLFLVLAFIITEEISPFIRVIQPEEMWLYRYPIPETSVLEELTGSHFKWALSPLAMIVYPFLLIVTRLLITLNISEARQAAYAYSISVPLTGTVVNIIKIFVGRPRPDFLARCYGMDYYLKYTEMSRPCTQDVTFFFDGRKSFPSGHTALAASTFGFMALYSAGQIGTFHERSKFRSTSVFVTLPLLMMPVLIGISRTCDYKHHWQDVLAGGLIGYLITFLCYRVYFPSVTHERSDLSYEAMEEVSAARISQSSSIHQVYRGNRAAFTTSEEEDEK